MKEQKTKKFLGYWHITPEMGSEGWGGYRNYMICEGNTPEEVVKDYFAKTGEKYDPSNFHISEDDGHFYYHDYFSVDFIYLPEYVYIPDNIEIRFNRYIHEYYGLNAKAFPKEERSKLLTKNSCICRLIQEHPNDWKEEISKRNINIREEGIYTIFNYTIKSNYKDPIVQEARGIIIDTNLKRVVCWPFRKFGKYNNNYADSIDWSTAIVQEKIDGSIVKLWYDHYKKKWQFSTSNTIYMKDSHISDVIPFAKGYKELIRYMCLGDDYLNHYSTYIFELASPLNRNIVKYNDVVLYHIGTRSNITGKEYNPRETLRSYPYFPRTYNLHSLEECIAFAQNELNNYDQKISRCDNEGFVVVDKDFNRVKIKCPIYQMIHYLIDGTKLARETIISLIHTGKIDIGAICDEYPEIAHIIKYYDYKYTEFMRNAGAVLDISRKIYRMTNDKSFVGKKLKGNPYSSIAFMGLETEDDLRTVLDKFNKGAVQFISNNIPEYSKQNYGYMFEGVREYEQK